MGRVWVIIIPVVLLAQFGPDVRVSDTTGGLLGCVEPSITVGSDSILYVVWASDYTGIGDLHLYFSRSTDLGQTWSPGLRIDDQGRSCLQPVLSYQPPATLYCIWYWQSGGVRDRIMFSRSTDGGANWSPSIRVDDCPIDTFLEHPEMCMSKDEILAVWGDCRYGWRIRFSKSTDQGTTWKKSQEISFGRWACYPRIAASGDTIYVVYYSLDDNIYLSRSTDLGETWEDMGKINDLTTGERRYQAIGVSPEGTIGCAWYDWSSGECEIRFTRSTDGGNSWSPSIRISDQFSQDPVKGETKLNILFRSWNLIYAIWSDERSGANGSWDIYCTYSTDGGSTWIPEIRVNDSLDNSQTWPSVALDSRGNPAVVWFEYPEHIYFDYGDFPGVAESQQNHPEGSLTLSPNPFSHRIVITYHTNNPNPPQAKIYDIEGRMIATILGKKSGSGYQFIWDGKNHPGGIYFIGIGSRLEKITHCR